MCVVGSPDIFQAKMTELTTALEFVQTYLDDLLCITRTSPDNHLEHLTVVLARLQEAGLKVNVPKAKFCAKEMEYLGYQRNRMSWVHPKQGWHKTTNQQGKGDTHTNTAKRSQRSL